MKKGELKNMPNQQWEFFKVGTPSRRKTWIEKSCEPFDTVYHVCHLDDAIRIIHDGSIRSSLIWDESRLNNTRTCVSWLSPNDWGNGSIYGNIQFNFNWIDIISNKNFYWVEAMHKYRPPAYRILVTDSDYSSQGLQQYDSTAGDGPIYFDDKQDTWYRNGKYTGEFLIDRDINLDECTSIEFIAHNKTKCKKYSSTCTFLKSYPPEIGARFISSMLISDIEPARRLLAPIDNKGVVDFSSSTTTAINYLLMKLCSNDETYNDELLSLGDKALAKAIFGAYSIGEYSKANILANILRQSCSVKTALIKILEEYFGESTLDLFYADI